MRWGRRIGAAMVAFGLVSAPGCGTDPIGVDACRRIEKVRCESAQACGISLENPPHRGDSLEANVAACTRYYDDQCLHGLAAPKDPGAPAVDACVQAIITGDCTTVKTPESHPSCAFLVPPTAVKADAGSAVDASADGGAT